MYICSLCCNALHASLTICIYDTGPGPGGPPPQNGYIPPTMVCPAPAPVGWHAAAVAFPRRRLWVGMLLLLLLLPAPITASATQQLVSKPDEFLGVKQYTLGDSSFTA